MTTESIKITSRGEWLKLRQQDLTASDVAAVAGMNPYRSAYRVALEKTGQAPQPDENRLMRRGRWFEAACVEAMREEYPSWDVRRAGVYVRDPDIRLGATPDVIAMDPDREGFGNVQCKVVSEPVYAEQWDKGPPVYYQVQSMVEGMLLGASWVAVAALIVSTFDADFKLYEIERHASAEARAREIAVDFWRNIDAGKLPSPDFAQDGDLVATMFPGAVPLKSIDLSKDNRIRSLLEEREVLKATAKEADAKLKTIETEIKFKLGEAELATVPGWSLSCKTQHRNGYEVKATSFRVLRASRTAEGDQF